MAIRATTIIDRRGRPTAAAATPIPRDNHYAQLSYDYTRAAPRRRAHLARGCPSVARDLGRTGVLLCHGSPRKVNEFLWESTSPDAFLARTMRDARVRRHARAPTPASRGSAARRRAPRGQRRRHRPPGQRRPPRSLVRRRHRAQAGGVDAEFVPVAYDWQQLAAEMRAEDLPPEFVETIETGWWTTCLEILPAKERGRGAGSPW